MKLFKIHKRIPMSKRRTFTENVLFFNLDLFTAQYPPVTAAGSNYVTKY